MYSVYSRTLVLPRLSGTHPSCILSWYITRTISSVIFGSTLPIAIHTRRIHNPYYSSISIAYMQLYHVIFITVSVYFTTVTAYIHILVPLTKTGFIVSTHRLNNITLLTLVQATSKGSRRPISLMGTHTQQHARSEYHTQQLADMSCDESSTGFTPPPAQSPVVSVWVLLMSPLSPSVLPPYF